MTNLRIIRLKNNLTQNEVAKILGIKIRHYQNVENGTSFLTQKKLNKLEDLFGLPQRVLLAKTVEEVPEYYHAIIHGTENLDFSIR